MKKHITTLLWIAAGSFIYAVAIQFFIFPQNLFLGGTSGVSVILNHFFPNMSSGQFLMAINVCLMILALDILGRGMAIKTLIGSTLTTAFVGFLENAAAATTPPIANPIFSALVGSAMIAVGSGILFYIDSSSGGTDIIALIIQKFSSIRIGRSLLIADILIVIIGACVSPLPVAIASIIGLLVKTFGIDIVIRFIKRIPASVHHT